MYTDQFADTYRIFWLIPGIERKGELIPASYCAHIVFFFWLRRVACGILVPRPGIEPVPPAVEVWSLNH